MNRQEVTQLLAAASTVDPYAPQPDELVLRIWTGLLDQVPMQAAEDALWAHYRASTETIKPADIVERWRDKRRHAPEKRQRPTFDPERIRDGIDQCVAALAESKGLPAEAAECESAARREIRALKCPHCRADVGYPCVNHRGEPLRKGSGYHDVRLHPQERPALARGNAGQAAAELATVETSDTPQAP